MDQVVPLSAVRLKDLGAARKIYSGQEDLEPPPTSLPQAAVGSAERLAGAASSKRAALWAPPPPPL